MTTLIDEVITKEGSSEVLAQKREERAERTSLKSFSETDPAPKPLVAFDAPPEAAPTPLTW